MSILLLLSDASPLGADISFNGPMLAMPYSLQRLGFAYVRNSLKTVYQNGAFVTLAANQFGTTYDAVTGLNAFEAEPAATNLALNSAGAAATWTVSNVTDAGTPITGFAASLAFGDNSVLRTAKKSVSVTNTVTYCASVYIEMDDGGAPVIGSSTTTGDMCIVLSAGGVFSLNLVTTRVGTTNLYRVSGSRAATATVAADVTVSKYTTQSARTFRIIGIQVETGARATSYIATAGATVTRAADVLSTATANLPGFNAAGYALVVDARRDVLGLLGAVIDVSDGTNANRVSVLFTASNTIQTTTNSGGATQAVTSEGVLTAVRTKAAYSNSANAFLRAVNGVAGTADTGGAMPVAPTILYAGCRFGGADQFNGYIYGFKLIPVALNQAQTTALTS